MYQFNLSLSTPEFVNQSDFDLGEKTIKINIGPKI